TAASIFGGPLLAGTSTMPGGICWARRMRSSDQDVPKGLSTALNVIGAPPAIGTFLSEPFDQKATKRPSGEKVGSDGSLPAVPEMAVVVRSVRLRRYSCRFAT